VGQIVVRDDAIFPPAADEATARFASHTRRGHHPRHRRGNPTQLSLFVLSAGVGGWSSGLLCVLTFAAGLLAMNTLMAVASAGRFHLSKLARAHLPLGMILTGTYSIRGRGAVHPGRAGFPLPI
jgi:hypothetical protein